MLTEPCPADPGLQDKVCAHVGWHPFLLCLTPLPPPLEADAIPPEGGAIHELDEGVVDSFLESPRRSTSCRARSAPLTSPTIRSTAPRSASARVRGASSPYSWNARHRCGIALAGSPRAPRTTATH